MKVDKNFLVYSNYVHILFNIHKHYCTGSYILGVAQNCGKMRGVAWIDATPSHSENEIIIIGYFWALPD